MNKIKTVGSDFKEIFLNNKIECIICIIGFIASCALFKFVDGISIQSWALELTDALFRGGFSGFNDIIDQNLWQAPHGDVNGVLSLPLWIYAIWNLPVLIFHYIFNTGYEISFLARMWGKLFFVLLAIAIGYLAYRTVYKITEKKQGGMIAAILFWGSASMMASVGYAMQDEVIYMFFMSLGLYHAVCGKKNLSLIWFSISCVCCPLMLLFAIPVILYSSKAIIETIWRLFVILAATMLEMFYISSSVRNIGTGSEINKIFATTFSTEIGKVSVVAIIILFVYLLLWSAKRSEVEETKYMIWGLALLSVVTCTIGSNPHYRFVICIPFIAISLGLVESVHERASGITALIIFEGFRMWIMGNIKAFLRLYAFPDSVKEFFGIETIKYGQTATVTSVLSSLFPGISDYNTVICGFIVAGAIWFLYVCYPNRPKELTCNIPSKVLSVAWCSIQILVMLFVAVFLFRLNMFKTDIRYDIHSPANSNVSCAIDGQNYLEEYYCGKSANRLLISVIPCTTGKGYPEDQELMLDIIDVDSGEVVATSSYNAANIKSGKTITFRVEDTHIEGGKWYKFRFYSSKPIDTSDHYMYLFYSYNGTAKPDSHYAIDNTGDTDKQVDYDFVSQVITF